MIIRIGRDPKNDIVVDNRTVSRQHATLEVTDGHIVLKDTGSKSGTYVVVNGSLERTTYKVVNEADAFFLGDEKLLIRDIIEQVSKKNRKVRYERNPLTGEIIKK